MVDLLFQGRFTALQLELSLMSLLIHLRATTIHHLRVGQCSRLSRERRGVNHWQNPLESDQILAKPRNLAAILNLFVPLLPAFGITTPQKAAEQLASIPLINESNPLDQRRHQNPVENPAEAH
ncbi:hypothetical protein [Synechococcus sp. BS56D]|uniref:hypothetical protein n=1 Tax=Synechococcus sp. BS56D TaxID=2055944 RepID=UPI0013875BF8|nr:hypothetical protein [Synechococcus sp. BS56D]